MSDSRTSRSTLSAKVFHVNFTGTCSIPVGDLGLDDEDLETVTAKDVVELMKKSGSKCHMLSDWNLTEDLEIHVDQGQDHAEW